MTTYIDAMGLAYRNHTVMVQVVGDSNLTGEPCELGLLRSRVSISDVRSTSC